MNNIKFLDIATLYFRLPDDFEGNIKDAFTLLGQYFYDNYPGEKDEIGFSDEDLYTLRQKTWEQFCKNYPHDNGKVSGAYGITKRVNGEYKAIG